MSFFESVETDEKKLLGMYQDFTSELSKLNDVLSADAKANDIDICADDVDKMVELVRSYEKRESVN